MYHARTGTFRFRSFKNEIWSGRSLASTASACRGPRGSERDSRELLRGADRRAGVNGDKALEHKQCASYVL